MKKSILAFALIAAPLAFGESTRATTMDYETSDMSEGAHMSSNTNDRFDNRDSRSNSASTPAQAGMENSRLDADITQRPDNSSLAGSSTFDSNQAATSNVNTYNTTDSTMGSANPAASDTTGYSTQNNRMSGSSTTSPSATGSTAGATTGSTTDSAMAGAAAGTAAGTAASAKDSSKTEKTTTTKTSRKSMKKASKTETASPSGSSAVGAPTGGSSSTDTSTSESMQPMESTHTGASTHNVGGSTAATRDTTSSETNMVSSDSYRRSGSSTGPASSAATGAAAGATAGNMASEGNAKTGNPAASNTLTAQDTSRNQAELEMIRRIRSEIVDNKDLSMNAHNIKVINQNGQVYLKGPVANATEKSKVEEIAKRVAGNTTVINQTFVENR